MNILLLCDKTVPELFPLMGELPVAQLPLLGKSPAEHHLELVCDRLRPDRITLAGGGYRNLLQTQLGDGARWGVTLDYPDALALDQPLPLLALPCDRLASFDLDAFLQQVGHNPERSATGVADGVPAVYWIAERDDWREVLSGAPGSIGRCLDVSDGRVASIDSIGAFHRACMGLLRGEFTRLAPGVCREDRGWLLAPRAEIGDAVNVRGRTYLGEASRIGAGATLSGSCAIGAHVLIDDHAVLENCVIMPHTYVGQWVALRNAVVSGAHVWRIDSGVDFRVDERFLLGQLPANGGGNWLARWLGRLGGRKAPLRKPVEAGYGVAHQQLERCA